MMNKKLLVVVPYRGREEHLKQFIPYIHKVLDEQKIEHSVLVVEQDHEELFNRGLLCNIGFLEYYQGFDYVCFHDVDMICSTIDYSYSDIPTCLLRHRSKFDTVYDEYFGGITIFPVEIFKVINGFSNDYWGWGCEDDDLRLRCLKSNINVSYRDGSCIDLELVTDDENRKNNPHYVKNLQKLRRYKSSKQDAFLKTDGLDQCKKYYKITNKVSSENLIHLFVSIKNNYLDSIFVFSSVGSNLDLSYKDAVFKSWDLHTLNSGCVIYNNNFPYNNYFKNILIKPGFKFPNFFYFDDKFDIINNYDYICVLDDDLLFKQNNSIEETVSVMQKFDISLCSLSNNNEFKKAAYDVMYSSDASKPRVSITNFCEMGCMIFHKSLLKLVKQSYQNNYTKLTDWGFDWYVCSLAEKNNHTIGIVKHLYFSNPFQNDRNIGYHDWTHYKDNINYIHPLTYGTINVEY